MKAVACEVQTERRRRQRVAFVCGCAFNYERAEMVVNEVLKANDRLFNRQKGFDREGAGGGGVVRRCYRRLAARARRAKPRASRTLFVARFLRRTLEPWMWVMRSGTARPAPKAIQMDRRPGLNAGQPAPARLRLTPASLLPARRIAGFCLRSCRAAVKAAAAGQVSPSGHCAAPLLYMHPHAMAKSLWYTAESSPGP